jgi:hypothetical protein
LLCRIRERLVGAGLSLSALGLVDGGRQLPCGDDCRNYVVHLDSYVLWLREVHDMAELPFERWDTAAPEKVLSPFPCLSPQPWPTPTPKLPGLTDKHIDNFPNANGICHMYEHHMNEHHMNEHHVQSDDF